MTIEYMNYINQQLRLIRDALLKTESIPHACFHLGALMSSVELQIRINTEFDEDESNELPIK